MTNPSTALWIFFLLTIKIALADDLRCTKLENNGTIMEQLSICKGVEIEINPPGTLVNLTGFNQTQFEQFFYDNSVDSKPLRTMFNAKIQIDYSTATKMELQFDSNGVAKIINNRKLLHFTFQYKLSAKKTPLQIEIRGNKLLREKYLEKLIEEKGNKLITSDSYIQDFGECDFSKEKLKSLDELSDCRYFLGDLIIDNTTEINDYTISKAFSNVSGNIYISNSNITKEKLDPLMNRLLKYNHSSPIEIINNTNLCLYSPQIFIFTESFPKLTIKDNQNCTDVCTPQFIKSMEAENKTVSCDHVEGDIIIPSNATEKDLEKWDKIKYLNGTIHIESTNFTNLTIFKSLVTIENANFNKRALFVLKNSKLTNFSMPSLKNITMTSNKTKTYAVHFYDNGGFQFTILQCAEMRKIINNSSSDLPCELPIVATTISSEQKIKINEKIDEQNEKTILKERLYIAGIVVFETTACIGFSLLFAFCYAQYKEKKMDREDKLAAEHFEALEAMQEQTKSEKAELKKAAGQRLGKVGGYICMDTVYEVDDFAGACTRLTSLKTYERAFVETHKRSSDGCLFASRDELLARAVETPFNEAICGQNTVEKMKALKEIDEKTEGIHPTRITSDLIVFNPKLMPYKDDDNIPQEIQTKEVSEETLKWLFLRLTNNLQPFLDYNLNFFRKVLIFVQQELLKLDRDTVIELEGPITIAGDCHGSMAEILVLLGGGIPNGKFLFLGDYMDRGICSFEVFLFQCIATCLFPNHYYALRGNHDDSILRSFDYPDNINRFGYPNAYLIHLEVMRTAAYLPIIAIINKQIFCSHAGPSPQLLKYKQRDICAVAKKKLPLYLFNAKFGSTNSFNMYPDIVKDQPQRIKYEKYMEALRKEGPMLEEKAKTAGTLTKAEINRLVEYRRDLTQVKNCRELFHAPTEEEALALIDKILKPFEDERKKAKKEKNGKKEEKGAAVTEECHDLSECLWLDLVGILPNERNHRNNYGYLTELEARQICKHYGFSLIVRAHCEHGFGVYYSGLALGLFLSNSTILSHFFTIKDMVNEKISNDKLHRDLERGEATGSLRICPDGTLHVTYIRADLEKPPGGKATRWKVKPTTSKQNRESWMQIVHCRRVETPEYPLRRTGVGPTAVAQTGQKQKNSDSP